MPTSRRVGERERGVVFLGRAGAQVPYSILGCYGAVLAGLSAVGCPGPQSLAVRRHWRSKIDNRLRRLISDYQDAVRIAVDALEANGIPRPNSTMDWIAYDVPQIGQLVDGGKYFIHGFGCTVKTPEIYVDFDFGEQGQIDGIDCYRMSDFARERLSTEYGIDDERELKRIFDDACKSGDLVDSGYILWYLRS